MWRRKSNGKMKAGDVRNSKMGRTTFKRDAIL